jgi:ABC-type transport system involved in multi-copper enzyme maturation permease subunit
MKKAAWSAVMGAARYEFRMQARRKAVWIVLGIFGLLAFTGFSGNWRMLGEAPTEYVSVGWAFQVQTFIPIAFGCLLADRVPRDRSFKVGELLETAPAPRGARLVGKYLGATLATLVPILLTYLAGIAYAVAKGHPEAIPTALLAFLAVNLPGLLFVAAFSVSVPAVLWVPLYQFLFIGYWFWGNLLSPDSNIPTISGTWLTPIGKYAANGFFGPSPLGSSDAAAWEGAVSIALLLGLAALALFAAHHCLRWKQARL